MKEKYSAILNPCQKPRKTERNPQPPMKRLRLTMPARYPFDLLKAT